MSNKTENILFISTLHMMLRNYKEQIGNEPLRKENNLHITVKLFPVVF